MHSSAKSPSRPGESQDEGLTHRRQGPLPLPTRGASLLPPPPAGLIVLSVRMAGQPQPAAGIRCNTRGLAKPSRLIYWPLGPEVDGILEAPRTSYRGITRQGQRAPLRETTGEKFHFVGAQSLFRYFFFWSLSGIVVLCSPCAVFGPLLGSVSLFFH